jgi:HD-like signal output (HDOD) protein
MSSCNPPIFEVAGGLAAVMEPPAPAATPTPVIPAPVPEPARELLEQLCHCPGLPALPGVAKRVVEMTEDPSATPESMAALLARDPVLAARVLRAANSETYGPGRPITSLTEAVGMIGLQTIRMMTVGTSLLPPGEQQASAVSVVPAAVRRRGVFTAAAARVMSQTLGVADPDSLMLLGLLADVGMLGLDQVLRERYAAVHARTPRHAGLDAAERAELGGVCHAQAGAALLRHWKLPEALALVVEHHHRPDELAQREPELREVANLIALASRCADVVVEDDPLLALAELRAECAERLSLSGVECDELLDRTFRAARDLGTMFDLPGDPPPQPAAAARAVESEQRRAVRISRPGALRIFPYSGDAVHPSIKVECRDLSVVSICCVSRQAMAVGQQFVIGLRRAEGKHAVIVYAVRRCDPDGEGGYRVGAEIVRTLRERELNDPAEHETALVRFGRLLAPRS